MGRRVVVVDVFAEAPMEGNRLAVVLDSEGLSTERMQAIALEFNFSETTFVLPARAAGNAQVRIFTPGAELPFAGHPTLGTGWVLAQRAGADEVVLEEGVGPIRVTFDSGGVGRFDHPGAKFLTLPSGALPAEVGLRPGFDPALMDCGPRFVVAALRTRDELEALRPPADWTDGVDGLYLFHLDRDRARVRMFGAPSTGIVEDPATGSGAGALAVYLDRAGAMPAELAISQGANLGRPSLILVGRRDGGFTVGGRVQPFLEGELSNLIN